MINDQVNKKAEPLMTLSIITFLSIHRYLFYFIQVSLLILEYIVPEMMTIQMLKDEYTLRQVHL
jgi:hypothetical protein